MRQKTDFLKSSSPSIFLGDDDWSSNDETAGLSLKWDRNRPTSGLTPRRENADDVIF